MDAPNFASSATDAMNAWSARSVTRRTRSRPRLAGHRWNGAWRSCYGRRTRLPQARPEESYRGPPPGRCRFPACTSPARWRLVELNQDAATMVEWELGNTLHQIPHQDCDTGALTPHSPDCRAPLGHHRPRSAAAGSPRASRAPPWHYDRMGQARPPQTHRSAETGKDP